MNLKTLRELKGISRKELADQTGVSFRSIQDYEQGHKDLSSAKADTLLRMSRALGCSMEALLSEKDLSEVRPSSLKPAEMPGVNSSKAADSAEKKRTEAAGAAGKADASGSAQVQDASGAPFVFRLDPADEVPYFLMHKDVRVASIVIEPVTGCIVSVPEVFEPDLLPVGAQGPAAMLKAWWQRRAVPVTQGDIQTTLTHIGFLTPQSYLVRNLGLGMTDCYWIKPVNAELGWKDVSLFRNEFEDVVATTHFTGLGANIDFKNFDIRFPGASARGDVPKAWICVDHTRRFLVKGSERGNTQQIFNEVVAAYMHRRQARADYVDYQFYTIETGHGKQLGASCESFTNESLEFVPARDLLLQNRRSNEGDYWHFLDMCAAGGLDRDEVIAFMDYMILTDFVITNTDRSFENFGVLRDAETLQFVKMAPIFDSGNSMFHALDMTRGTLELKNIPVRSFAANEAGMVRLVRDPEAVDLDKLLENDELTQVLLSSNRTPEEVKLIVTIYNKKKDLLFKLTKGDMAWMR